MAEYLTTDDQKLIRDYVTYHLHSPLNSSPEDYRHFNHALFNVFKLNFGYTVGIGAFYYYVFLHRKHGLFRGFISSRKGCMLLFAYSSLQYVARVRSSLYTPEVLSCAKKYEEEVARFNDHFHRLYGNE